VLNSIPAFRIRDEFPFLRRSDCPVELKILVADMLTAYDAYKLAHDSLFKAETFEQIHKASRDTVENYLENHLIWDELNYYKEKGAILGKHPIFHWMERLDAIRRLKVGDLVNLKRRLENNLVKNRVQLRREPGSTSTADRQERIHKMEQELIEVNRMLNL
jgi:hypothetical protein